MRVGEGILRSLDSLPVSNFEHHHAVMLRETYMGQTTYRKTTLGCILHCAPQRGVQWMSLSFYNIWSSDRAKDQMKAT